jgi:hypothetical protein
MPLLLLLCLFLIAGCATRVDVPEDRQLSAYDDAPWAEVLAASVRGEEGLVDYAAVEAKEDELNLYLDALARFGPKATPGPFVTADDRLAYHLNAYNAFMLKKWLDNGAATASPDASVGWLTWFFQDFAYDGRTISMDSLEQRLIRREFDDSRIHYALICGAMSCPPLLDEPFVGDRLDEQLDELGRRWLAQPDALAVDDDGTVRFSRIFAWYRDDFDEVGGLAGVVRRYVPEGDPRREAALAALAAGEEEFQGYDWTINSAANANR